MSGSPITLVRYDSSLHSQHIDSIVEMHVACIEYDNSLMRFHPPFDAAKRLRMAEFWKKYLAAVDRDESTVLLAFTADSDLCGTVTLGTPDVDTGPHRGSVEMLMVSPHHQRKGIAQKLMKEVENVAREKNRTLFQLQTTKGSAAEVYLYPKLGYVKVGETPRYGVEPVTGKWVDGVYFYKHLNQV